MPNPNENSNSNANLSETPNANPGASSVVKSNDFYNKAVEFIDTMGRRAERKPLEVLKIVKNLPESDLTRAFESNLKTLFAPLKESEVSNQETKTVFGSVGSLKPTMSPEEIIDVLMNSSLLNPAETSRVSKIFSSLTLLLPFLEQKLKEDITPTKLLGGLHDNVKKNPLAATFAQLSGQYTLFLKEFLKDLKELAKKMEVRPEKLVAFETQVEKNTSGWLSNINNPSIKSRLVGEGPFLLIINEKNPGQKEKPTLEDIEHCFEIFSDLTPSNQERVKKAIVQYVEGQIIKDPNRSPKEWFEQLMTEHKLATNFFTYCVKEQPQQYFNELAQRQETHRKIKNLLKSIEISKKGVQKQITDHYISAVLEKNAELYERGNQTFQESEEATLEALKGAFVEPSIHNKKQINNFFKSLPEPKKTLLQKVQKDFPNKSMNVNMQKQTSAPVQPKTEKIESKKIQSTGNLKSPQDLPNKSMNVNMQKQTSAPVQPKTEKIELKKTQPTGGNGSKNSLSQSTHVNTPQKKGFLSPAPVVESVAEPKKLVMEQVPELQKINKIESPRIQSMVSPAQPKLKTEPKKIQSVNSDLISKEKIIPPSLPPKKKMPLPPPIPEPMPMSVPFHKVEPPTSMEEITALLGKDKLSLQEKARILDLCEKEILKYGGSAKEWFRREEVAGTGTTNKIIERCFETDIGVFNGYLGRFEKKNSLKGKQQPSAGAEGDFKTKRNSIENIAKSIFGGFKKNTNRG